jgi:predicted aspartyl protease
MIVGTVNAIREPLVSLRFRGPSGVTLKVSVLIDTGYDGVMALPPGVISTLVQSQGRGFATGSWA